MKNEPEIIQLLRDIERDVNRRIRTPHDFDFLALEIWNRLHQNISTSTLKRLWRYVDGTQGPRLATLTLLARFVGYTDWDDYCETLKNRCEEDSATFSGEGIRSEQLAVGDMVEVSWLPNRHCVFRYDGNMHYTVVEQQNSKLRIGDRFDTACFLVGQPMYLDNLKRGDAEPTSYVAGKKHGITNASLVDQDLR
jgi:hypothetical protein